MDREQRAKVLLHNEATSATRYLSLRAQAIRCAPAN
jgi:hypothetical protein